MAVIGVSGIQFVRYAKNKLFAVSYNVRTVYGVLLYYLCKHSKEICIFPGLKREDQEMVEVGEGEEDVEGEEEVEEAVEEPHQVKIL